MVSSITACSWLFDSEDENLYPVTDPGVKSLDSAGLTPLVNPKGFMATSEES